MKTWILRLISSLEARPSSKYTKMFETFPWNFWATNFSFRILFISIFRIILLMVWSDGPLKMPLYLSIRFYRMLLDFTDRPLTMSTICLVVRSQELSVKSIIIWRSFLASWETSESMTFKFCMQLSHIWWHFFWSNFSPKNSNWSFRLQMKGSSQ